MTRSLQRLAFRAASAFIGDPRSLVRAIRGLGPFVADLRRYRELEQQAPPSLRLRWSELYPRLAERYEQAGSSSGHYFHQDIWAARKIHEAAPPTHHDVGSRVDGFIAHLLAFREVHVLDLRPLASTQPGLHYHRADMLALPLDDRSIPSLSCLHAVEHVGLGRYGDVVDPLGHVRAMSELQRVLMPGGRLYFSVPIGRERLEFDAHRVLAPATVLDAFAELRLVEFAAVDDAGDFVEPADPQRFADADYSCGLFLFERPAES